MALKFDLSDLNPPTWFKHPDDPESEVCLRVVEGKEFDRINKITTKRKIQFKRGQRFEVEKIDEDKRSALIWQYSIVDWKGIEDSNGETIECTDENKVLLMRGAPPFANWVTECIEELNENFGEASERAEKNLSPSQNHSQTEK